MKKKKAMKRSGMVNPILPAPQEVGLPVRWCGCKIPKDYPKIDIHNSSCKRRRWLKEPPVGKRGEIPKVYPSGRKVRRGDGPPRLTPIHQIKSKQWFFNHDYDGLIDHKTNVWLAFAKRYDAKHNK
jgi:hypothetical protein